MAQPLTPLQHSAPYRRRFIGAFVILSVVLAAAAGGIVALVMGGGHAADTAWSPWRPSSAADPSQQIANRVAAAYRLDGGGQLVSVRPGPLQLVDGTPLYIVVGSPSSSGQATFTYVPGNGIVYLMCGLGKDCAIKGKSSTTRFMLVRREALELALYTFKYTPGVDSVVVLPPTKNAVDNPVALLFRRDALGRELSQPLSTTLAGTPPTLKKLDRKAIQRVSALTARNVFSARVESALDGGAFLVLEPVG
ncbi:MAG: hypothetical protein QOK40_424 [Miltoncostaeaceae bacterium]|jgi:hypothetical protein|nr:hypothetical protein [Miltoncostaeaceae bacterium]